jgi:hypothetical protein
LFKGVVDDIAHVVVGDLGEQIFDNLAEILPRHQLLGNMGVGSGRQWVSGGVELFQGGDAEMSKALHGDFTGEMPSMAVHGISKIGRAFVDILSLWQCLDGCSWLGGTQLREIQKQKDNIR